MKLHNFNRILFAALLIMTMLLCLCACGEEQEVQQTPTTVPPTTNVGIPEDVYTRTAFLGDNLYITDVGNYTGIYMEDGSDEFVSDVLMIVLKNENENAIQLARISLEYADFTANFEVTNLPAGKSVVLLEKDRHEYSSKPFYQAKVNNLSFFQTPMSLQEDKVALTPYKGAITVENLTEETLGEVYIYYKNSAQDLLYGGITYRARAASGLKPGRKYTVMTNHYNPESCTILDVQILPVE